MRNAWVKAAHTVCFSLGVQSKPALGSELDAGEIGAQQLRPEDQRQAMIHQADFILNEAGE